MEAVLLEWHGSRAYQAALQYANKRDMYVLATLKAGDPFRDPTGIARTQGISSGLFDLFDYVKLLADKEAKKEQGAKE